jgi:AraC family transcriptional regulator, transcriptional activator FtrA
LEITIMKARHWMGCAFASLVLLTLIGALRAWRFLAREAAPTGAASFAEPPPAPSHDPSKSTVVIVLGADVTEITDALGPYEMFARAERFNVYMVAPSSASTTLTGGLRVRPHYSFAELDELLEGGPPLVVVAPNLPNITSPGNRPVVEWVRRSADAGATSLSWCAGAAVLAEAGLLDGRLATSHWGDLARLERDYPQVRWHRGVRFVDQGEVVTSAGITSGIDATLRLLIRLEGEDVARRVANELRYTNFHFALRPETEQYVPRASDAVLFLNAAFAPRSQIGLALYEGAGELDLSAPYDAHAAAGVAEVRAVAATPDPVRTAHGLWLEPALAPEHGASELAALDRLIVPGRAGRTLAAAVVQQVMTSGAPAPEFLQAEAADRFSLEPVLEDLAQSSDLASATFARRRLEYRSSSLRLVGSELPAWPLLALLLLSTVGAGLLAISLALRRRRHPAAEGKHSRDRRQGPP